MPGSAQGLRICISTGGDETGNDFLWALIFFSGEFLPLLTSKFSSLLTSESAGVLGAAVGFALLVNSQLDHFRFPHSTIQTLWKSFL